MAKAKELPETYLCETDGDRESIVPYAGQKCIMQNGDIYLCIRAGVWVKLGTEPTPPTPTDFMSVEITENNFNIIDYGGEQYFINTRDGDPLGLVVGTEYRFSIVTSNNETYSVLETCYGNEGIEGMPTLEFIISENSSIPADIKYVVDQISINDGVHYSSGEPEAGGYMLTIVPLNDSTLTDISAKITKIVINLVES